MPSIADLIKDKSVLDANLAALQQSAPQLLRTAKRQARDLANGAYVTQHEPTKAMLRSANMLADRSEPVLIMGETGTGKELVASILHAPRSSGDKPQPLVPVNCSGLTDTLFESLVFGHKRGSFTGAVSDEPGLLRSAESGTAFLDEVGELPLAQQAKLLRVLQTNKVRPVGDHDEYPINCRFVFATNRHLQSMVENGLFRADLYYRISRFVLRTFPLSERPCDIAPIAQHIFNANGWGTFGAYKIPPSAYTKGNVRQLENFLFRVEVLSFTEEQALLDL